MPLSVAKTMADPHAATRSKQVDSLVPISGTLRLCPEQVRPLGSDRVGHSNPLGEGVE